MRDPLVERAAAAVADAYAGCLSLPEPLLALTLNVYFDGDAVYQLAPPVVAIPRAKLDWCAANDRLGAAHSSTSSGVSWASSCSRSGAPNETSVNDWLPRSRAADAALAALDVLLSERIDHDRVAAVFRHEGRLLASARLTGVKFARELRSPQMQLGDDPCVVAGRLPAGAVRARVLDLFDVWHEAHVGGGAWLCVLGHEARGGSPPVVFVDAAGAELVPPKVEPEYRSFAFGLAADPDAAPSDMTALRAARLAESREVLRTSAVKALWPATSPRPAQLRSWGWGDDKTVSRLGLQHGELAVEVHSERYQNGRPLDMARTRVEQALSALGPRGAARAVLEAPELRSPGTVSGREMAFECVAAGGRWAAAWTRRELAVTVDGEGDPPARLDLEPVGPEVLDPP